MGGYPPALAEQGTDPLQDYANNWCAVIHCSIGVAAAVMASHSEPARRALAPARVGAAAVLARLGTHGGWAEGLDYWGWALQSILTFADVLGALGPEGSAILSGASIAGVGDFPLHLYLGGGLFAQPADSTPLGPYRAPLLRLAALNHDEQLQWLADEVVREPAWRDAVWRDPTLRSAAPESPGALVLFDGIDWAAFRGDRRLGPDMMLLLTSGYRTGHSHLDANHVLLHAYGETLLTDPGRRPYTEGLFERGAKARHEWTSTGGHNTVLIDGLGQSAEESGPAGEILASLDGPHCRYVVADAASTYPPKAQRVRRHILFVDDRYFVIADDLEAEWAASWEVRYHTQGAVALAGPQVVVEQERAGLILQVTASHPVDLTEHTDEDGRPYITVCTRSPVAQLLELCVAYPFSRDPAAGPGDSKKPRILVGPVDSAGPSLQVVRPLGLHDLIRWGRGGEGGSAAVVTRSGPALVGFTALSARSLSAAGHELFAADAPVSISARLSPGGATATVVAPAQGAELTIRLPHVITGLKVRGEATTPTSGDGGRGIRVRVPRGPSDLEMTWIE